MDNGIVGRFLGSFFGKYMFHNIIKIVGFFGNFHDLNDGRI